MTSGKDVLTWWPLPKPCALHSLPFPLCTLPLLPPSFFLTLLLSPTADFLAREEPRTAHSQDARLGVRSLYTLIPSPLSPAPSSACLMAAPVTAPRRPPYMAVAVVGNVEWNPPVMTPCSPTLKLIFNFPSSIPGMNNGEWELWVSSTLPNAREPAYTFSASLSLAPSLSLPM